VTTAVFAVLVLVLRVVGAVSVGPALTAGYAAGLAVLVIGRRSRVSPPSGTASNTGDRKSAPAGSV
jgi:hypothetical protein